MVEKEVKFVFIQILIIREIFLGIYRILSGEGEHKKIWSLVVAGWKQFLVFIKVLYFVFEEVDNRNDFGTDIGESILFELVFGCWKELQNFEGSLFVE